MRLFLGLALPEELREEISPVLKGLAKAAKPENLHITTKFLGETDKLDWIVDTLRTFRHKPVRVSTGEVAPFKNMLWLAATGPESLAAALDALLESEFPREFRPYKAHVTLSRARTDFRSSFPHTWIADELLLYRTSSSEDGPQYEVVGRFPLK